MKRIALVLLLAAAAGCASSSGGSGDDSSTTGTPTATPTSTPPAGPQGVWNVSGQDGIGSYSVQAELVPDGEGFRLTRVIRYSGVTVEGGRDLWWVWEG